MSKKFELSPCEVTQTIQKIHTKTMKTMNLIQIAQNSIGGKSLDIKSDKKIAENGPMTGKMLDGKFATARSAG